MPRRTPGYVFPLRPLDKPHVPVDNGSAPELRPPLRLGGLANAGGPQGFLLLILLRLIPAVPYNLINYAFGLTDISFGAYMLASGLGIIPGTFVFINIGDKAQQTASPAFWIALGLLGALCILTALLGRRLFPETGKMDKQKGMDASHGTKNK